MHGGSSISKVPYVTKSILEDITTLTAAHLFQWSITAGHTDAFFPAWHEFKNSVAVQIALLHSQPLTNSHLHFFITLESATSQVLLQRPKRMGVRRGKVRAIGL
jgi:hypothetical protein